MRLSRKYNLPSFPDRPGMIHYLRRGRSRMRDYRKWKTGNPKVVNLQLDASNPRIPRGRGIHEQRDLIAELLEHDRVYELAKAISVDGYFPLEYLIAIEEDGKTVVIEGNRRLAALKLLINPELAPEASVKRFRTLSANISLDIIDKVPTIYAPSREMAAPLIMQKHTRQQVERWSVLMQASFFKSLAQSGVKLSELSEEYGRPQSEIAGFLRTDTMYAIACSLDYPNEEVAARVRDPREFPAAVLQRLLDIPKAREFLGIEFKEQVKLSGNVDTKDFKRAYAKIITDIAAEDVDTRKLNTVADVEKYLSGIGGYKPKSSSKGSFGAETFDIDAPEMTKGGAKASTSRATKVRKSEMMIPSGIRCELRNQRIVDIFDELRRLRRNRFPNSCAVMIRILLELCVGEYLEATGQIKPLLAAAKKKGKANDWYPTLRQLLAAILADSTVNSSVKTLALKKLNRLISAKDSLLSLDDLDGYVHNPYMHPSPRDLVALWEALEGLFHVVLKQPPSTPRKAK